MKGELLKVYYYCAVVVVVIINGVVDGAASTSSKHKGKGGSGRGICSCYFVFGDSQADNGNNNDMLEREYGRARADYKPYGIDFSSSSSSYIPTGRFTNARNVPDFIGTNYYFPPLLRTSSTHHHRSILLQRSSSYSFFIFHFSAKFLGFDDYIPPFRTTKSRTILKGANYASGGAGILRETGRTLVITNFFYSSPLLKI